MNVVRQLAAALLVALVAGALVPGAASAASMRTVYVDDNGTPNAAGKGACGKPNYAAIQAAVNDLTAKKVVVCAGNYVETVTVQRSLKLEGRAGATIKAPAGDSLAIVEFRGPQRSLLNGFTITGAGSNVAAGVRTSGFVCEDTPCGPTEVTIEHTHVSDIYSSGDFGVGGTGIFIYKSQANVEENTVERYGYAGIDADGGDRAGTFAQIDSNTIRGQGKGGASASQIGIRLDETFMDLEDNAVSGNYGGGAGDGIGILVVFANGAIHDNAVTDNHTGVHYGPGAGTLRSNDIHDNAANGIELFSSTGVTVVENNSFNNGGDGIHLHAGATGNTVRGNRAHGNGGTDIFDGNGAPLVNTYSGNTCGTSNPSGLCT